MNFKKKLQIRLIVSITLLLMGIGIIISSNILDNSHHLSAYGLALAVISIVRIRNYFLITKSDEKIRKQEIAETDERTLHIANKARSLAFYIYIIISAVAVILFQLTNKEELALVTSASICTMLIIHWICYFVISKKH